MFQFILLIVAILNILSFFRTNGTGWQLGGGIVMLLIWIVFTVPQTKEPIVAWMARKHEETSPKK